MTIPAERGGFAGRMAIRNHDRDVVDGTIADDDDACAKRQKLEEALHKTKEAKLLFDGPAQAAKAESKPTKFNVRTAFCPACCGTELFSCGGNAKHYYYRCKICDPRQTGPTFKSPRPPPSYNK